MPRRAIFYQLCHIGTAYLVLREKGEPMLTMVVESRETASEPFEDRYVDVCTFRTRFWQAGSGGSAVVLLAGIGCSVLEWQNNIAALAARHRVYAFDMLGHGLT